MATVDDIRLTFNEVPELYDRIRPGHPDEFFDVLFAALPTRPAVVEVGAGPARLRLRRSNGAPLSAVEIGHRPATFLTAKFADVASLTVVNSGFEAANLRYASFDAVVSACAYHWMDERQQLVRPAELLRPGGRLAIMNLTHVESPADHGYFTRVQPIYEAFGQGRPRARRRLPDPETFTLEIHDLLRAGDLFEEPELHGLPWHQTYTSTEFADLVRTYSAMR